jgi:hypothetical protein
MQADTGFGSNRSNSRPRGAAPDRLDRRLRCDKGLRSGSGRMDDCGSPCAGRVDPLLEEFKNNRTRKWQMRVRDMGWPVACLARSFLPFCWRACLAHHFSASQPSSVSAHFYFCFTPRFLCVDAMLRHRHSLDCLLLRPEAAVTFSPHSNFQDPCSRPSLLPAFMSLCPLAHILSLNHSPFPLPLTLLNLQDILGHMLDFSLDQLGSRFIQQKLDTLTPEELEAAFAEIAPKAQMLMNDVFGNYVIQKFLELDVETHRQDLAQQMKGSVSQQAC